MKKYALLFLLPLFMMVLAPTAQSQIRTPAPSPAAKVMQTVGLTDVMIEYSRPAMKGRTIFAKDGLVPTGAIWRTGANAATKISFSDDVTLGGVAVAAGDYAILTKPNGEEWMIMMYPYEASSFNTYVKKEPTVSMSAKAKKTANKVESFTMGVNNLSSTGASIDISWENTMVSIPLVVDVDTKVMADIERTMAGPSMNDYFNAGTYMHESGKDLKKALEYVQKATKVEEPRYWQVRREALILADLGRKAEAIKAAKLSLELATKAENKDFIRMNEASIKEWSMK